MREVTFRLINREGLIAQVAVNFTCCLWGLATRF